MVDQDPPRSDAVPPQRRPGAPALVLAAATFTLVLDLAGVVILLPSVQADLQASVADVTWVVAVFVVVTVVTLPLAARLSARFGARRTLLVGLGVFGMASLAVALSPSVPLLLAARGLQGLGAALAEPAVRGALRAAGDGPPARADEELQGLAALLAAALGPVLPAALATVLSWRAQFWLETLLAVAVAAAAWQLVPADPPLRRRTRTDGRAPLLPWPLLRRRRSTTGNVVRALTEFTSLGVFFPLSGYLQDELGHPPLIAGLLLLPIILGALVTAPAVEAYGGRVDARWFLVPGLLATAAGVLWLARVGPGTPWWFFLAPLAVVGAGIGAVESPTERVVRDGTPPGAAEHAWLLSRLFFLVGVGAGVVTVSAVWQSVGVHAARGVNDALMVCAVAAALAAALAATLPARGREDVIPPGRTRGGAR